MCGYALFVYYGGKHVLQPENERFQLGDLVLLLSTVKSFGSSISSLFKRMRGVGRGYLGVQVRMCVWCSCACSCSCA